MYILINFISFLSILLLIMPTTVAGIIQTLILTLVGIALFFLNKHELKCFSVSKSSIFIAFFPILYFGFQFYYRWLPSSKVHFLAALLHLSTPIFLFILSAILCLCATFCISFELQKFLVLLADLGELWFFRNIFFCLLAGFVTVLLSQVMICEDLFSMGAVNCLWGTLAVFILILFFYVLTGNPGVGITLGTGLFMVISTVNVYVYSFRNRLFEPVDLFSARTALNVAENYNIFPVPSHVLVCWGIWAILLICLFWVCEKSKHTLSCKRRTILALCCLIGTISVFSYTSRIHIYRWDKNGATYNGYILDYVSKIDELYIPSPDGYNSVHIQEISERYAVNPVSTAAEKKPPHIIVVMDEAFSDLSVLGNLSPNMEIMPFISSLNQDVISGYSLVSVLGGNTSNSEYEFLTGNSMAWMSPNSVPYQQYIHSSAYSIVSYLKNQYDYRCVAVHPYSSSGWNRPEAYSHFGFDQTLFVEDFPQEHYIRNYISDQEMFEVITELYKNHHTDPLFLFGVSMQNHGDYTYRGKNFTQTIHLDDNGNESQPEQYLSLIHETDKAVEYLISYFEDVNEDVIIVFFGDHQPNLEESFFEDLGNNSSDSLNDLQKRYLVPFFIWANYDIEEAHIERTSLNYLSSYMYEAAGIPLPPYNRFLSELEENIPAINANGFYSLQSQCYLPFDQASDDEQVWLQLYEQLQYNSCFDTNNRNAILFPVSK